MKIRISQVVEFGFDSGGRRVLACLGRRDILVGGWVSVVTLRGFKLIGVLFGGVVGGGDG